MLGVWGASEVKTAHANLTVHVSGNLMYLKLEQSVACFVIASRVTFVCMRVLAKVKTLKQSVHVETSRICCNLLGGVLNEYL